MGAGGRVLVGVCLLLTATVASGAPGSLDPTFGSGGWVTNPGDVAVGVAIQPDDRIVVVGQSALYRYEPDGAADGTFGAGGQAALVHGSGALALQPADGKILLSGFAGDVVTTRYATDGSVDTTFGTLGTVTTAPTAGLDYPTAIAVQPDGKIVVVGAANSTFIFLARYDSGGTPDPTFGTGGLVITDLGASVQRANAVRVQPDGKLVIAGPINVTGLDSDELVARYDASGVLDPGFGVGGVVQLDLGTHEDLPNDLLVQPDGTIVTVASTGHSDRIVLARLLPDGTPDPGFGTGGIVTGPTGDGLRLVRQPTGELIAVGSEYSLDAEFALYRILQDGTPDATFGSNGYAEATLPGRTTQAHAGALQSSGKLVVVGLVFPPNGALAAARFLTGGSPAACGDGTLDPGEGCDDGNTNDGDCCSSQCQPVGAGGPCDADGNPCTIGRCGFDGRCFENPAVGEPCADDGDPCTIDICGLSLVCLHLSGASDPTCSEPLVPGHADLRMTDVPGTVRGDRVRFVWSQLDTSKADFGSPDTTTGYQFCLFEVAMPGGAATKFATTIPPGCDDDRCWTSRTRGWKYRSRSGEPDGVTRLALGEGHVPGHGRIDLKFAGPALTLPSLPFEVGILSAQLRASDGRCWRTPFLMRIENTSGKFHAQSP